MHYAYTRTSTDEQQNGLDAQATRIQDEASRRGWDDLVLVRENGSARRGSTRPEFERLMSLIQTGDVLVVTKVDRLARSTVDFGRILEKAAAEGWDLVILDLGVDTTTSTGKLVANIIAAVAEWERDVISERTRDGLRAVQASGKHVGRPRRQIPPHHVDMVHKMTRDGLDQFEIIEVMRDVTNEAWYPAKVRRALRSV